MTAHEAKGGDHILVAVGEGRQLTPLLSLGCALAGGQGRVTVLHVDTNGRQPNWLPEDLSSTLPPGYREVQVATSFRAGRDVGS